MDEFEDIESTNETWTYEYMPETTLTTVQIISLIWSLICIFPNVLLVYLIAKNTLYRKNFHFVIFHWTIVNLLLLAMLVILSSFPEYYVFYIVEEILMFLDSTIRFIPIIFATFFIFDKYVRSEKFCRYSIWGIWGIFIPLAIAEIFCVSFHVWDIFIIYPCIACAKLLSILIFIVKSIIYCIRGSDEETYQIRLTLSGIYIILGCIQWFYNIMYPFREFSIVIRVLLIVMFYGNGFVNLVVLVRFDPSIKLYFRQLFGKEIDYLNVQFSRKKSDILATLEANETVPVPGEVKT